MAENEYKLTIADETGGGGKSPVAGQGSSGSKKKSDELTTADMAKGYIAGKKFVAPFVNQIAQHELSLVSLRTGNSERQARAQFGYQIANEVAGIGESIALGAMVSPLKGAGALVGAIVGVTRTAISYFQKADTLRTERSLENISIGMVRNRSGIFTASVSGSR